MEKCDFQKLEYVTLREEIKETKARIFKLVSYGIIIVPGAQYLSIAFPNLEIIKLTIPILVIVLALLYLSENHALMRCGKYIKDHIEKGVEKHQGWEHWLDSHSKPGRRTVDIYMGFCFYLLFFIYYTGSSFLAVTFLKQQYDMTVMSVGAAAYMAFGVWFIIFLIRRHRSSTTTEGN